MKRGKVVLQFVIQPDGSVAGLQVMSSSGDVALDRRAYGSISGSNPFPPLPEEFTGPYLGLRFSYYYNMEVEGAGLRWIMESRASPSAQIRAARLPSEVSRHFTHPYRPR